MTLNELLVKKSITIEKGTDGFVKIRGRFVAPYPITRSDYPKLEDSAIDSLTDLKEDFRNIFTEFLGLTVSTTRLCNNVYDIDAYGCDSYERTNHSRTIEGGLRYSISLAYGMEGDRIVPTFEISTCQNKLPRKVDPAVEELFLPFKKKYDDAVEVHNRYLQAYYWRLFYLTSHTSESSLLSRHYPKSE